MSSIIGSLIGLNPKEKGIYLSAKITECFDFLNRFTDPNGFDTRIYSHGVSALAFYNAVYELFRGSDIQLKLGEGRYQYTEKIKLSLKNKDFTKKLRSWLVQYIEPIFYTLKNQMENEKREREAIVKAQREEERVNLEKEKRKKKEEQRKKREFDEEIQKDLADLGLIDENDDES
jgi:hypothetical protein